MSFLMSAAEALLLVLALSMDAFAASFAYGANRVRIPFSSVLVISGVCSGILGVSLLAGGVVGPWLPPRLPSLVCFILLLAIGVVRLCDSSVKSLIRRKKLTEKKIKFCFFSLCFILDVYANPEKADRDYSRILSAGESASLAFALSLDGLAAGFGAGLASAGWLGPALLSLAVGIAAVKLGGYTGQKLAEKLPFDLSWISGAMLIILAFMKLW